MVVVDSMMVGSVVGVVSCKQEAQGMEVFDRIGVSVCGVAGAVWEEDI